MVGRCGGIAYSVVRQCGSVSVLNRCGIEIVECALEMHYLFVCSGGRVWRLAFASLCFSVVLAANMCVSCRRFRR